MKNTGILKIITIIILHFALLTPAQEQTEPAQKPKKEKKKNKDIMYSEDIQEIENFLETAHPEDPRRKILKKKLIELKNVAWVKGRETAKPMAARPVVMETEIPQQILETGIAAKNDESEEFKKLFSETSEEHKEKTVKLLNAMFNEDITSNQIIILLRNNSDCNLILRVNGAKSYDLAVPARQENAIVIEKGNYQLTSNVCDAKYDSSKNFVKSTMITINNPVYVEEK
ncbi:MAG: hypothetical protein LBE36_00960 [Flavobacteriaceae bacterium]|jgi:hypothetical protein|nr:hypothetical protein [Flavobacteriaceae bacterium]